MTKKPGLGNKQCNSNSGGSRIRRVLHSRNSPEKPPRRSARLISKAANVSLNVNSRVDMKRSGIHDAKLIFQGPDEFMPGLENNPKIKRFSPRFEKKRAIKKGGKVKKARGKTCRNGKGNITGAGFVINLLEPVASDGRLEDEKDKEGVKFLCVIDKEKSKQGSKASSADDKEKDEEGEKISSSDGARHDHAGDLVSQLLENLVIAEKLDEIDRTEKNNIIPKSPHKAKVGMSAPILVSINCTSLTDTSDVFRRILEQCQERKKDLDNVTPFYELKSLLCQRTQSSEKKMMLLILDEMDYLITRDQSVLYDLFSIPTFPHSYCILIGVANAIDLTDRFLPKLQCLNCKPMVVTFHAYTKDQILRILQQRLMDLPYEVFQPQALELCARKVAAASGDMRKALFVCRGAVEMLEEEIRNSNNLSNIDSDKKVLPTKLSSPLEESVTKQDMYKVRIDHMASVLAKTFQSAVVDTIQSLPQHQQMVLCSAVKLFRNGKKYATLGELNAAYLDLCKKTSINSLTVPEFSSMCGVLSDQALLNVGQAREDKLRRVTLKVDEGDIIFALQGIRFFRNCLQ